MMSLHLIYSLRNPICSTGRSQRFSHMSADLPRCRSCGPPLLHALSPCAEFSQRFHSHTWFHLNSTATSFDALRYLITTPSVRSESRQRSSGRLRIPPREPELQRCNWLTSGQSQPGYRAARAAEPCTGLSGCLLSLGRMHPRIVVGSGAWRAEPDTAGDFIDTLKEPPS